MDSGKVVIPMKCSAHRVDGSTCNAYPVKGMKVCRKHGGSTPQAKRVAAARLAKQALDKAVSTYGLPVDVSPTHALLDEVRWTAGHVCWLREQIQQLEHAAIGWNLVKQEDRQATEFEGTDLTTAAAPNVLIELYQRERRHLVDVCKAAISAGIEERHLQLAEQQGEILAAGLHRIFDQMSLTIEQRQMLPTLVPKMLESIRHDWTHS